MTKEVVVIEAQGVLEKEYGEHLRQQILEAVSPEVEKILLDLKDVSFINSSGLGILASVYSTLKRQGKELYLCSLNDQLRIVFEITAMDSCFKIYADREAFKEAFK